MIHVAIGILYWEDSSKKKHFIIMGKEKGYRYLCVSMSE